MMDADSLLMDIGLTRNEVKVYVSALELGTTTSGAIIKKTGLHTSKVYDALGRLMEKGLVSYILMSQVKHFTAVKPERLVDFLDDKKSKIDMQMKLVKSVLPALSQHINMHRDETRAEIFSSWKGMETVYRMLRDSCKKGELTLTFGASLGEEPERVTSFFMRHVNLMVAKGIHEDIIFNDNTRGLHNMARTRYPGLFRIRYMANTSPSETVVWRDNVMIVILSRVPTAVLIRNKIVADAYRQYFGIMWGYAKP